MGRRKLIAEDIFRIHLVGNVALHPDHQKAAFVVSKMDKEQNTYQSHIWIQPVTGGEPVLFTNSAKSETSPAWSPDGKWLAFLSNRNDENQVFVLPETGGEAIQVTNEPTGVQSFQWSPLGNAIAFVANVSTWPHDAEETKKVDETPRAKYTKDVKVIRRTFYRLDGVGYFGDRRSHLFVVNLDPLLSGRKHNGNLSEHVYLNVKNIPVARLTAGEYDVQDVTWSPDGRFIVFISNIQPDADETFEQHLYRVQVALPSAQAVIHPIPVDELECLARNPHVIAKPEFSPDGQTIAFLGHGFEHGFYAQTSVWTLDVASGAVRCLTAHVDQTFTDASIVDTRTSVNARLCWSDHGRFLYSLLSDRGTTQLVRIDVQSGSVNPISNGEHTVLTFSMNRNRSTAVVNVGTTLDPCNLYAMDIPVSEEESTNLRQLTDFNAEWLREVEWSKPERFTFESDGHTMDGWVMLPSTEAPRDGYPTVLQVHGGPMGMYADAFMFEFQLICQSGIAVVYTNPRGSLGYGQAFCSAIRGAWGQKDFHDIESGIDAALSRHPLNQKQVAIAGGSYGGFMAAWAIGHTKRYKASIVMRACINEYSMFGTCDLGYADAIDFECTPWDNPERYFSVSPITAVSEMEASVLIIHSENDLRCPIEQAEQLYTALRVRKVPVEFVRFPDESHGLSRNGQPWHRVFRLEKIQRFLETELS